VPIELGIALWLLERQLGLAFLAPGAVIPDGRDCDDGEIYGHCSEGLDRGNSDSSGRYCIYAWIYESKENPSFGPRGLGLIVSKSVKMLGFVSLLTNIIQGLRITELRLSSLFRKLLCVRVFLGNYRSLLTSQADTNITT